MRRTSSSVVELPPRHVLMLAAGSEHNEGIQGGGLQG